VTILRSDEARTWGYRTSGSGRWRPLRWNFMTPSGLKVFDVIGRRTSISSLRRVVAVNRYSVVVTSITSSIELRATKVSSIISKLYREFDSFHVAEHVENVCSTKKLYTRFFYVYAPSINIKWIIDFYLSTLYNPRE